MTPDEAAVYVNLQTVQDYLSEREKAFLVLVDEAGTEITLPSRMPLFCFRRARTDPGCKDCYRDCLAPGLKSGAAEWGRICAHGLEHIVVRTSFGGAKGAESGESRFFLIAGRCADKNIAELTRVTAAFYRLPLLLGRTDPEESAEDERLAAGAYDLTARELAVLRHMARGLGNKDIAALLYVSPNTIKTHINHILAKMGAKNRTEASLLALQNGLTVDP
ncbi:MAG: response regulator transcription factor [Gracilibacteraceae bacterium]|nr:response regulator transcription factor [Gracilibacteraceae bacterium]